MTSSDLNLPPKAHLLKSHPGVRALAGASIWAVGEQRRKRQTEH